MKKLFRAVSFSAESQERIEQANAIIIDYLNQGLKLTLRQLYYQFVSRGTIPNTERSYKNLGNLISKGRLAGLIDWDAIEDRIRVPMKPVEFENPEQLVDTAVQLYRLPRRRGQKHYVELWVEKDALAGVLSPIAEERHITLMVNRGYSSSSAMYESASRMLQACEKNESDDVTVLYLGDMDPSGQDMVRDVADRLALFGVDLETRKLALTMDQVDQYKPPPNPAKMTDSRAKGYVGKYGNESWEVDALRPEVLRSIIESEITSLTDQAPIDKWIKLEEEDKARLRSVAKDVRVED